MKKGLLVLPVIVSLLTFWGCSKYKVASFVMPTWDTQLSAPIFNHTYTLGDLLGKDTVMVSNGDTTYIRTIWSAGVLAISKDQPINSVKVGNNLKIGAIPTVNVAQSAGTFVVNPPAPISFTMKLSKIIDTTGIIGMTVPIAPPIPTFSDTLQPKTPFEQFKSVTISSANLLINVVNGYAAKINLPNGLTVTDTVGNTLFTIRVPGDTLGAYETYSMNQTISSVTLPNNPKVQLTVNSPGTTSPTKVRSDTLVAVVLALSNIKVSSAEAIIPAQAPIVIDKKLGLVDSNKISTASIESGMMNIGIKNGFDISSQIKLVINNLKDPNGNPLTLNVNLDSVGNKLNPNPGSQYSQQISLANWNMDLRDSYGNPTDSISYSVTATIPGSGGQYTTISNTDSIRASLSLSNLQISSLTGIVHLKNPISIPTDTQKIDLGDFRKKFSGSLTFSDSTQLALKIFMSGGFPFKAHLSITPRNSSTNTTIADSVSVDQTLYPGPQGNVVLLGPSFVRVLNLFTGATANLPDELIISGNVIMNPTYVTGTITSGDSVYGVASILLPFDLGIANAQYSDSTDKPVFTSDVNKKLDQVDSGQVVFEINNGLPLGIKFSAQLIDTLTHQILLNLPKTGPMDILPATDFNSDGSVRTPMFSRNAISLTGNDAKLFPRAYMKFNFNVATSPGHQTVLFTKNNKISLKAYGNFAFKVQQSAFK